MKCFFTIILSVSLIAACTRSQESEAGETVSFRERDCLSSLIETGMVENIEIVRLTGTGRLLGGDTPMRMAGGEMYVADLTGTGTVYRFDMNGNLIGEIGTFGRGPQEYIDIKDFFIENDTVRVYSINKTTLYSYTNDGNFAGSRDVGYLVQKMLPASDGYWWYLGYRNQYGPDRVVTVDKKDLEITGKYLPSKAVVISFEEATPNFARYGDKILMRETFNNKIYSFAEGDVETVYGFDFGKYNVPREYFEKKDAFEAAELLFDRDFAVIRQFMENDGYCVAEFMIQCSSGTVEMGYALKDKRTERWKWVKSDDPDGAFFGTLQALSEDGVLFFIEEPEKILRAGEAIMPYVVNGQAFESLREDDNNVVVKVRLKNG